MATMQKARWFIWAIALVLVMACGIPSFAPQTAPTVDPGLVHTLIAQTANAAATQTAAALPSATPTSTAVPTRNTETPTPTATSTMVFLYFSPTPVVLPVLTNAKGSGNYSCEVTRVSPPNGSIFNPRDDFDAIWTVKNTGKRNWDRTEMDYIYATGAKMHIVSGYDLAEDVAIGRSTNLGVDMRAPKDLGTYTTIWTMRRGERTFCELRLTIVVRQ